MLAAKKYNLLLTFNTNTMKLQEAIAFIEERLPSNKKTRRHIRYSK